MKAFRVPVAAAAALVVCGALAGCSGADAEAAPDCLPPDCVVIEPAEPIHLGSLLNTDDPVGRDTAAIVAMTIDYLDGEFDGLNGRLLGRPVELVSEREVCNADSGREGAARFAENRLVLAVVGTTCSGAAFEAAAPVLSDAGILMVSSTNTSPLLTESDTRQRFYFRTAANDLLQAAVAGDFVAKSLGARSVATWSADNPYSKPLADGFVRRVTGLGSSVVARVLHPADAASVGKVAAELAAVRPEVIFLPLYEPECIAAAEAIRAEPRLDGAALLVSEGCQTAGFLRALAGRSEGIYSSGPDATGLDAQPFYRLEFLPAYQRLVDERAPITSSAATFDAVNMIFFAIRTAARAQPGGAIHIHREDLRRAMLTLTQYPGLSGTLGCSPLGDCVRSARMSIYRAPDWPVTGAQSRPVYSETLNLAEISQGL